MNAIHSMKRLHALLFAALAFALGGCATDRPASTPYKGNAVWDIASARVVPSRALDGAHGSRAAAAAAARSAS